MMAVWFHSDSWLYVGNPQVPCGIGRDLMLFNDYALPHLGVVLAISQPEHALISGQILAAWARSLDERVVLAAGQHDVAWLDWEVAPAFDAQTGRPREFRTIGVAEHAPMWERGVDRALAAWGRRVALLVSRHGSTIYRRFNDRHRSAVGPGQIADELAAQDYLARHQHLQDGWAAALGLDADTVAHDAELIAFADTLSLILCGALPVSAPLDIAHHSITLSVHRDGSYGLDPWPFASNTLGFEIEARPLPEAGRFADAAAMQDWLADPARTTLRRDLVRR